MMLLCHSALVNVVQYSGGALSHNLGTMEMTKASKQCEFTILQKPSDYNSGLIWPLMTS